MKKPSVTKLLDILNKPALIAWANRKGLEGVEINAYRKKSKAEGLEIHRQVELACKGEAAFENKETLYNFNRFFADKELLGTECKIETEWFVGRFDISFCSSNGEVFIADFKRGFKGRLYLEHKLQLIAYTMAQPGSMAIIKLPEFEMFDIRIPNREPYEQLLIHLSGIYHLLKEC